MGYVAQNKQTGKYMLGLRLMHFSYLINNHLDLKRIFNPYIQKAADELKEVSYLGIPYESDVLYLDAAYPHTMPSHRSISGEFAPMTCTGLGKAMLAFMPEEQCNRILSHPIKRFTEFTICDPNALKKDLLQVRENGFAVDNMEHEFGVKCVAVPVIGMDGQIVAAISVSGPSLRFGEKDIPLIAGKLKEIVDPIQNLL